MKISTQSKISTRAQRTGAAAVEFAIVAPIFVSLIFGVAEMGRALDISTNMTSALREGGRLASMHYNGVVPPGMTTEEKVLLDIRNVLKANGVPGDEVTLTLTHADGPKAGQDFDLDDPSNYLKNFQLTATVAYEDVSTFPIKIMSGQTLTSKIVFRLGRSDLSS
ncbi:TadE family protein [Thalassoglobus sp.]|uniref:TadE family protein n=1 Tax=Thalassoglobus sp. TaxID=2795869 RepID=UPI003AA99FF1